MRTERIIGSKRCFLYENGSAADILIQPIDQHDLDGLDEEAKKIQESAPGHPFLLVAFLISDWNTELSPWEAPAVFGSAGFGAGGKDTLAYIVDALLPELARRSSIEGKRYYLGGYSLAGLFALWAAYQTDLFSGIAAVSPSVWFPKWKEFMMENAIHVRSVYLSLGDREEKTRNKTMAEVGNNIRLQQERLRHELPSGACVLEWNPGNHFADCAARTAKGFAWLLNRQI